MPASQGPPSDDEVRGFVIAAHGDLVKVKHFLDKFPSLLNTPYPWSETDKETAIQAAAQTGNRPIAEYLLAGGAPLEICTAAMLGQKNVVERLLKENPERIKATGAHGIPLLTHAALSGNLELVQFLYQKGARTGNSMALHNAINKGNYLVAKWILENARPDLAWKNFQGKTALAVAEEQNAQNLVGLLKEHGAAE